jgi:hypothetical protein
VDERKGKKKVMSIAYTDVHTGRRERTRRKLFSAFFITLLIVVVPFPTFFLFYFILLYHIRERRQNEKSQEWKGRKIIIDK